MKLLDVLNHWAFYASSIIIYIIQETIKGVFFSEEQWTKPAGWRTLLKRTSPILPVILGGLLGLIPGIPAPGLIQVDLAARVLYFGASGVVSAWIYKVISNFIEKDIPSFLRRAIGNKSIAPPPNSDKPSEE